MSVNGSKYIKSFVCASLLSVFSIGAIAAESVSQEMSDFLAYNPEFSNQKKFSVLIREDAETNTQVFLSKNMKMMPLTEATPGIQAVQCNDNETEVCITVTKDHRITKQSCECVGN